MAGPQSDATPRPIMPPGAVLTAKGTIVGMPAMVRHPLSPELSTTLRSVRDSDFGPSSDAFHPERWSQPPSTPLPPIIPCEEPEDEDVVRLMPLVARPAATIPAQPSIAAASPTLDALAQEPVILPMGHTEGDRRVVVAALVVSFVMIASALLTVGLLR